MRNGCDKQDHFSCENLEATKQNQPLEEKAQKKCDVGNVKSCYELGFLYFHGEDISPAAYYPYLVGKDYLKPILYSKKPVTGRKANPVVLWELCLKKVLVSPLIKKKRMIFIKNPVIWVLIMLVEIYENS